MTAFALDVDFPTPYWDHMSDASKDLVRRMLVMDPKVWPERNLNLNWSGFVSLTLVRLTFIIGQAY